MTQTTNNNNNIITIKSEYSELVAKKIKTFNINPKKLTIENVERTDVIEFINEIVKFENQPDATAAKKELLKILKNPNEVTKLLIYILDLNKQFLFDTKTHSWFEYECLHNYVWSPISITLFSSKLKILLEQIFPRTIIKTLQPQYLVGIQQFLMMDLSIDLDSKSNPNLCVFIDKIYDTENRKTLEDLLKEAGITLDLTKKFAASHYYIRNYNFIPYNPNSKWEDENNQIRNWLNDMFSNKEDNMINVFRAICNIVIRTNRAYNLHFFVEIHGPGGSGKSTASKLIEALIGPKLVVSTNLEAIKNSIYETQKLVNKNLILMSDQETYIGDSSFLKASTGGDLLPIHQKYKDSYDARLYGVILIVSNKPLIFSAGDSAIMRRRISFNFNKPIPRSKIKPDLINFDINGMPAGLWKDYLSSFVNWVLEFKPEEVTDTILNYQATQGTNPEDYDLMWWMRNHLCPFKNAKSLINKNNYGPPLYDEYKRYCKNEDKKPISRSNFASNLLTDFPVAFPGYEITEFKGNVGEGFNDVTYQCELKENFENWRQQWKNMHGDHFFGNSTHFDFITRKFFFGYNPNYPNKKLDDNLIHLDETMNEILKKNYLNDLIGYPYSEESGEKAFNEHIHIKKPQIKTNTLILDSNIIKLTKKMQELKFLEFLNLFEYEENMTILTKDLFNLFKNFCTTNNYPIFKTENSIKNYFIKIWNQANSKPIKAVKNIKPNNKNGIIHIKIKAT